MRLSSVAQGCSVVPNISAMLGPYRSQSHRPVRAPLRLRACARLEATVLLPTPPLPLATAITCFTPSIFVAPGEVAAGGFFRSMSTCGVRTPGTADSACMHSRWICCAILGSSTARDNFTNTSSPRTSAFSTKPNETMSRLKPGYFTALSASRTDSAFNDGMDRISSLRAAHLKRIFADGWAENRAPRGIWPPCAAPPADRRL